MSLTISLIAVLIPLLFMADVVGRLFREFAITLAVSILISLVVSLTLTPMMSARLLRHQQASEQGWFYRPPRRHHRPHHCRTTARQLAWVLRHQSITLLVAHVDAGADGGALRRGAEGVLSGAGYRRHSGDQRGPAVGVVLGHGGAAARRCARTILKEPDVVQLVVVHRGGRKQPRR